MNVLNTWSFALFSANVHRYLPEISWKEHEQLYNKWIDFHQQQPLSDQQVGKYVDERVIAGCQDPSVICIFHLGDHLLWPVMLVKQRIRFNVLMDKWVYQNAKDVFDKLLQQLRAYGHTPELLFSDDPSLLIKVRSRKAKGQHLLCFADGSSGLTSKDKDDRVPIPFLADKIWLKKGIPFISHLFGMPIISLFPTIEKNMQSLKINKLITPYADEGREEYTVRCLKELYGGLERLMRNAPFKWECWGYLHRNGMIGEIYDSQIVRGDNSLVKLPWGNKRIWFDRIHYSARLE